MSRPPVSRIKALIQIETMKYSALLFTLLCLLAGQAHSLSAVPEDVERLWADYQSMKHAQVPANRFPYQECFELAAEAEQLPIALLLAVARGESNFNPKAVSKANARGIMQILWPGTAKDLGFNSEKSLEEPCPNIQAGARYLKQLVDRYDGDYHLALAAYNYGLGRISSDKPVPKGAKWYSGYIYNHLVSVMDRLGNPQAAPENPDNQHELTQFARPYQAGGYVDYLRDNYPDLAFEWFRNAGKKEYFKVVLLYENEKDRDNALETLRKAGIIP